MPLPHSSPQTPYSMYFSPFCYSAKGSPSPCLHTPAPHHLTMMFSLCLWKGRETRDDSGIGLLRVVALAMLLSLSFFVKWGKYLVPLELCRGLNELIHVRCLLKCLLSSQYMVNRHEFIFHNNHCPPLFKANHLWREPRHHKKWNLNGKHQCSKGPGKCRCWTWWVMLSQGDEFY